MTKENNWFQEAVFYELYIRAYADSKGDGKGDFRGAIEKLDHIKSLGVNCIWIMPMYPSPLKDDGYDVADYYNIHPDYGDLDDFKAFLEAAHERGLKVITDLVMNHTSADHPWFQAARSNPDSPYRDYYVWSDTDEKYSDTRIQTYFNSPASRGKQKRPGNSRCPWIRRCCSIHASNMSTARRPLVMRPGFLSLACAR